MVPRALLPALWLMAGLVSMDGSAALGGEAEVLSAETLRVGGQTYRLAGIDAPEPAQRCRLAGKLFSCGAVAKAALMDLVAGSRAVSCAPLPGTEHPTIPLARCRDAGYDLSEGMTYTGWALADRESGQRYRRFEDGAAKARRGLWRGKFVFPWDWRAGVRLPEEDE